MISSSKVVKAHQQSLARQRISVEVPLLELAIEVEPQIETALGEVVNRAKQEARAILEQAEVEAEKIRQGARQEGHEMGRREGRQAALEEVRALWEEVRNAINEPLGLISQSREYLSRLNDETTLAMAAALTMTVFSRLRLERLDVVTGYIQELAAQVDKDKVEIFLDSSWAPRLHALEEALGGAVSSVTVAVDEALASGMMRAQKEGAEGALGGPLLTLKALLQEALG